MEKIPYEIYSTVKAALYNRVDILIEQAGRSPLDRKLWQSLIVNCKTAIKFMEEHSETKEF